MEPTKASDVSDCRIDGLLDRITQLPNPVLNLILCKVMDTRQVVKTMILSKSWQNLWAPVPYLCFHDRLQDFPGIVSFVNTVLQLRDPSDIHTFRVQWRHSVNAHRDHHLTNWAEHIVGHNIKVLELDIYAGEHAEEVMEFPHCIFTCQTLEELKLESDWMGAKLSPHTIVQLSRLKKLHLYGFCADSDSLKNLISGCPVLEDLKLEKCNLKDPEVSSDTLRQLIIESSDITGIQLRISCPNLHYLSFFINSVGWRVLLNWENVSSVVEGTLRIDDYRGNRCFSVHVGRRPIFFDSLRKSKDDLPMFRSLKKRLKLYGKSNYSPIFCNLKRLKLYGQCMEQNFVVVIYFLQRSPNLELLTLQKGVDPQEREVRWYNCPHFKLKVIFDCNEENERLGVLMEYYAYAYCNCDCP
ncbi:uncharacterized protein M6B38_283945 [Iris pallida]|uniref:F-box/LRR-repeat protein 15/At3g58940/PEG3-like LRR domain-containing protein n=1 Tax=Iris pallida TaxID=29817 RepID=A0AAX6I168_IRIPA|nr:uncharacterized protein M6B38_283945 [Iris pallida]